MTLDALSLGVLLAGLISGLVVSVTARAPIQGLRCLMDFLVGAGLIRLVSAQSWQAIAVAALTVVVRQLAGRGLPPGRRRTDAAPLRSPSRPGSEARRP